MALPYGLDDEWSVRGPNILDESRLAAIRACLEQSGPVIVEHRFYRMGCAPERRIFDDFEEFRAYVTGSAGPGDSFWVWDYSAVCRDDNPLTNGKKPDEAGRVPLRGAY